MTKNLDKELDELFKELVLPTDDEVKEETRRARISKIHKGKTISQEQREKMSAAHKNRGPVSEETKAKLSSIMKTRVYTGQALENMQEANRKRRGRPISEETRAKLKAHAEKRKGVPISEETRAKISAGHKGKVTSEETKAKLRAANLGKKMSEETRAKLKGKKATNAQCVKTGWTDQVFSSLKLASEWAMKNGIGNAKKKLYKFLKTDPINFYYISKEEYERLSK